MKPLNILPLGNPPTNIIAKTSLAAELLTLGGEGVKNGMPAPLLDSLEEVKDEAWEEDYEVMVKEAKAILRGLRRYAPR